MNLKQLKEWLKVQIKIIINNNNQPEKIKGKTNLWKKKNINKPG